MDSVLWQGFWVLGTGLLFICYVIVVFSDTLWILIFYNDNLDSVAKCQSSFSVLYKCYHI